MKTSVGYVTHSNAEHMHNCYEIIFYRKGSGVFYFSKQTIPISSGKFIIVPPNTVHSSKYDSETETIFIIGDFNHIFSFSSPTVVMDDKNNGKFLVDLIFENRFQNVEYLSALSNALAHFLVQNIRVEKCISLVLQGLVNEISDNFYDSNFSMSKLLKKSGYAEDYIRAQFKIFTGKTPVDFLNEMRINHASYLMDIYINSMSLNEIAEKCGYTDYVYFSRKFKQVMGMSPRNYIKTLN